MQLLTQGVMKRCLLAGALLLALGRAGAVERTLRVEAPGSVGAGRELTVRIVAGTDAGTGEQIGFLQAEYSLDVGKTWTAICYLQNLGTQAVQQASLKPGPAGTTVKLRVRAAFRGGLAGDVDYNGAAILWNGSWAKWQSPPARLANIVVTAP